MGRLLFEKKGRSVWISHLDLMRLFQRAFQRAGLPLSHSQGFHPRPLVSIALPLSVGVESGCEILDFELDGVTVPETEIRDRLNSALVEGIRVLDVYGNGRKVRELTWMRSRVEMIYDGGVPEGCEGQISRLFARESVVVPKKTKSGMSKQDLIPMIREIAIHPVRQDTLCVDVLHCCQNPTLNPMQIPAAVEKYLPALKPDHCRFARMEILDDQGNIFR